VQNFRGTGTLENFILYSLLPVDDEWLDSRLEAVEFQQWDGIYQLREQITAVYFPTTCLLSWTNSTEMGERIELGVTGNEGMAGATLLLNGEIAPWQVEAQLPGGAFKLSAEDFIDGLARSARLRQRVGAFLYLKMVQLNQSALCNRFHSVEERLCRWLLVAQDHTKTVKFLLTRDILAQMIGARRPAVSLTTGTLQSAGLIRASRGEITILNREGIEDVACECYRVVRQALEQYLSTNA
jgi:CRP-like cAMP-binding protein